MIELSVVIPCLNEEETVGVCIKKASKTLEDNNVKYEIIVADNGSTDNSIKIASSFDRVRVIHVKKKGYGMALRSGITNSNGKYILMADADNSYDFNDCMKFLNKIRDGFQLVQGCRFPSGGGKILEGAMPISHKIFGNPILSKLAKNIYKIPFDDIYCGMRCFEKEIYMKKNYFSEGMTFAVENLIKLVNSGAKSTQVPITLYKDGRIKNKSHLRTIHDGFLTLKMLLICSPKWLYFFPSLIISIFGLFEFYSFINKFNMMKIFGLNSFLDLSKTFFIFMMAIQIFSIGIFTTLISYQIGLQKKNWVIKLMKYLNLKNFFIFIIFESLFVYFILYLTIKNYNKDLFNLIFYQLIYCNLIFLFNGLLISFLELVRFDKD